MTLNKKKIAIFISGRGSNMLSIIKASQDPSFPAEISLILSSATNAAGVEKAKEFNIPALNMPWKRLGQDEFEKKAHDLLKKDSIDLICLAGFIRILSADFILKWSGKIINIHPSLLPAFKGLEAQKQAFDYGVKYTGCTVHHVVPELDAGPIIHQKAVPVKKNDTLDNLKARILEAEHICYPEAIELLLKNKV